MKIVMLDFDGVLNSHAWMMAKKPEERGGVMGLDSEAVARVNRLLRETGALVVVSSTWRHNRDRAELQRVLEEVGFDGTVIGRTPRFLKPSPGIIVVAEARGNEIQAWLDAAPDYGIDVETFVILDDDADMAHLSDRLIKTSSATGLLDSHVDDAIEMLRAPSPLLVLPTVEDVARMAGAMHAVGTRPAESERISSREFLRTYRRKTDHDE